MQHLSLEALLLQVGKNFQRSRQRIALSGGEKVVTFRPAGQHLRKETLEDALGPAGTYVYKVQRMASEILEVGASEVETAVRENAVEELVADFGHRLLVMQAGSDGINCYHKKNLLPLHPGKSYTTSSL